MNPVTQIPSVMRPVLPPSVAPTPPAGVASWLSSTISQPLFIPYNVNQINVPLPQSYISIWKQYGTKYDGIANYTSLGTMGNFGSNLGNGFYCSFEIRTTSTSQGWFGTQNASGVMVQIQFNAKYNSSTSSHDLCVVFHGGNGNYLAGGTNANTTINFNDGNIHTIVVTANFSTNTLTISIDGQSQTITYNIQAFVATWSNFSKGFMLGAYTNSSGTLSDFFACTLDNFQIGTSPNNLYGSYLDTSQPGIGNTLIDSSGNNNNGTLLPANDLPVWTKGVVIPPTGFACWASGTISQPFFTPWDENYVNVPLVVNEATYFKPPTQIVFSSSTISQPIGNIAVLILGVMRSMLPPSIPLPVGVASWLTDSISQPYFIPWNEDYIGILPVNVVTYFKPPLPPTGIASWASDTISQPYFTPIQPGLFNGTLVVPRPPVIATVGTMALNTSLQTLGQAAWLTDTILQPYFAPYNINNIVYPANVGTYFKKPLPPAGIASWLNNTISQPYFTPYDVNQLVWSTSRVTYFKAPTQIFFSSNTIAQPVENVITLVSSAFIIPRLPSTGTVSTIALNTSLQLLNQASWLDDTISQPYFTPWDENKVGIPAPYVYTPILPGYSGFASWASSTISQPFFIPWNENFYTWPASIATYFKTPPAPTGVASWLSISISQPYFTPWNENHYNWPASEVTYFKAPLAPVGTASWLNKNINQPYIPALDVSGYKLVPYPIHVTTLKSTVAIKITLQSAGKNSIVAILTILEKSKQSSTIALVISLEKGRDQTVALYTELSEPKSSTISLYTLLEEGTQSTVGLFANLVYQPLAVALLTTLQSTEKNYTVAILTYITHWLLHAPYDKDNQGIVSEPPTPWGGGSKF